MSTANADGVLDVAALRARSPPSPPEWDPAATYDEQGNVIEDEELYERIWARKKKAHGTRPEGWTPPRHANMTLIGLDEILALTDSIAERRRQRAAAKAAREQATRTAEAEARARMPAQDFAEHFHTRIGVERTGTLNPSDQISAPLLGHRVRLTPC